MNLVNRANKTTELNKQEKQLTIFLICNDSLRIAINISPVGITILPSVQLLNSNDWHMRITREIS